MKVTVFSTKSYDREFLEAANGAMAPALRHELVFLESRLDRTTAALAADSDAVCAFVNDRLDRLTLERLAAGGIRAIALRCAGFNNIHLPTALALGLPVVRVPAYSPHAVAEHTVGLILTLNRRIHRAYNRVRESNFALEGLMGFDLHGETVGIVGTGRIGAIVAQILHGFGMKLLGHDRYRNPDCEALGMEYVDLPTLWARSAIISLHCPLMPETHHLINADALAQMRDGVMLVNTSRGALVDTEAVIAALKSHKLGYLALDVYEQEERLFFENLSEQIVQDDIFQRLQTFPNVLITGHQAFFTRNALAAIAETTVTNLSQLERNIPCPNQLNLEGAIAA